MNGNFRRNLLVSTGVSLLILIVSSTASYISIKNLLDSNAMVNHTQEVIYQVNYTKSIIVDAQLGLRGYLITGQQAFLDRRFGAEGKTSDALDKLEALTSDNSAQQVTIKEMRLLCYEFYRYYEKRIEAKNMNKAVTTFDLDRGKQLLDQLNTLFKRMESRESALLKERIDESNRCCGCSHCWR